MTPSHNGEIAGDVQWFAMRDLKRPNAKLPAYVQLRELDFELFTPMKWVMPSAKVTPRRPVLRPVIQDLLFVRSTRERLDEVVRTIPTLQYRFARGQGYCVPMTVPTADMERFIHAVEASTVPQFFLSEELDPSMLGKQIRIIGGPLDGYEGTLLRLRGQRVKRLLVELPGFLSVAVEVNPEYVQVLQ